MPETLTIVDTSVPAVATCEVRELVEDWMNGGPDKLGLQLSGRRRGILRAGPSEATKAHTVPMLPWRWSRPRVCDTRARPAWSWENRFYQARTRSVASASPAFVLMTGFTIL